MKIRLIYVGKSKKDYLNGSLQDFYKRIKKFVALEEVIIPDISNSKSMTPEKRKLEEGKALISSVKDSEFVILMDEKGKSFNSRGFAQFLEEKMIYSSSDLVIVVGGAFGFSDAVYQRANQKMSLSDMTFSHQLIRLILAEQLYRALTIIKGHPYHND